MLSFGSNDYSYGACPEIPRPSRADQRHGVPPDTAATRPAKIQPSAAHPRACEQAPTPNWLFLVGGTQTNQTVIDTMLAPYEGVVTVDSGHPNVHEAGAIESTGHKVITLPHHAGKLDAAELDDYCATFYADDNHEHMVFPGLVYIFDTPPSTARNPNGKAELEVIADGRPPARHAAVRGRRTTRLRT